MMGDAEGRGHGAAAPAPRRSRRTQHAVPVGTKSLPGHAVGTSSSTKILCFLGGNRRNLTISEFDI